MVPARGLGGGADKKGPPRRPGKDSSVTVADPARSAEAAGPRGAPTAAPGSGGRGHAWAGRGNPRREGQGWESDGAISWGSSSCHILGQKPGGVLTWGAPHQGRGTLWQLSPGGGGAGGPALSSRFQHRIPVQRVPSARVLRHGRRQSCAPKTRVAEPSSAAPAQSAVGVPPGPWKALAGSRAPVPPGRGRRNLGGWRGRRSRSGRGGASASRRLPGAAGRGGASWARASCKGRARGTRARGHPALSVPATTTRACAQVLATRGRTAHGHSGRL